jgi:hypothetical protein
VDFFWQIFCPLRFAVLLMVALDTSLFVFASPLVYLVYLE